MISRYYSLEDYVKQALNKNEFSSALDAVKQFVVSVINEHKAPGEVIGSRRLDELCRIIGDIYFDYYKTTYLFNDNYQVDSNKVVIICTGLYKYGGTSLLIGDLIKAHGNDECTILATNFLDDMSKEDLELSRIGDTNAEVVIAPKCNSADKLKWLVEQLIKISPARIFLLNHHQDSVIISAVQPFIDKTKVIFYHHADHNLCLGVHLKGAIHIDPHNVGYFNCRDNENIANNFYLPLTVDDKLYNRCGSKFLKNGELTTCSSATFHKFKNFYLYPYVDLIVERFLIREGVHFHIGNIPEWDKAIILDKLREQNIDTNRFVHIAWVPCLWKTLVEKDIDLFIGSFPISGARTLIEVMGAGVPILMAENYLSRFHSSRDIVYSDSLIWQYPQEFCDIISSVDEVILNQQSAKSRNHYVLHYSNKTINIDAEIEHICSGKNTVIPYPLHHYNPDYLDRLLHFSYLESFALQNLIRQFFNSNSWKITKICRFIRTIYRTKVLENLAKLKK